MTVFVSDTWTGSNGSPWSSGNWVTGQSATGASATIQSNAGRMNAGSNTSYGGKRSQKVNATSQINGEIQLDFRIPSSGNTDIALQIALRGDTGADGANGYIMMITATDWWFSRIISYSDGGSALNGTTMALSSDTWYTVRFQAIGSTIRAKVWLTSGAEPGSWLSATDSSITTAGTAFIACLGGGGANGYVDVDNFVFSDGATVSSISASETITISDAGLSVLASITAAEFGTETEFLSAQSRMAVETAVITDLGSIAGTPVFATETARAVDAVSTFTAVLSANEPVLAVDASQVFVPPIQIMDWETVTGHDFPRRTGKGPYRLMLPWTEGPRARHPFFRRLSVHRGLTLVQINGVFSLLEDPTFEQLVAADRIYLGGYDNWVTDDEAQDLGDAGWADIVVGFEYIPDAFYGSGMYGVSVYGN